MTLNQPHSISSRPWVAAVLAMSVDGKIADVQRSSQKLGSREDFCRLEQHVAAVDAVVMGAGTLRSSGTAMRVLSAELRQQRCDQGLPEQPQQWIVSRSGRIDPHLRFFQQPIPRGLITTQLGLTECPSRDRFDWLWVCERAKIQAEMQAEIPDIAQVAAIDPPSCETEQVTSTRTPLPIVDLAQMLNRFAVMGIQKLAVLGGGELVASFLEIGAIDELFLTLCPLIVGGATAPTLVDGMGFFPLDRAPRLSLVNSEVVDYEVFLHYRVRPIP